MAEKKKEFTKHFNQLLLSAPHSAWNSFFSEGLIPLVDICIQFNWLLHFETNGELIRIISW